MSEPKFNEIAPLPLSYDDLRGLIDDADGGHLLSVLGYRISALEAATFGKEIVRRVNLHDELVAALELILALAPPMPDEWFTSEAFEKYKKYHTHCVGVLAKARGE